MTDLRTQLQTALDSAYTLGRELGRGGMATVYLAQDVKHDRKVALKVMHPELAATLGPERFQREIRTTARLQHPNILTVLDSGEAAGQLWYTMPLVEGESLRSRLQRERQLSVDDALQITREVADALGYAHTQGVVHRDIKPENILLSGGHALVADFGVARALQAAGSDQLTQTGMSVGTPAYMSPEQSLADPIIDGRSDLYSLGCVLYEMLAGEAPYTGPSAQAIVAKRLREPVPHVRTVRETVPVAVDQALERVLSKTPADRFPTAVAFVRALTVAAPPSLTRPEHPSVRTTTRWSPPRGAIVATAGILGLLTAGALWQRHRSGDHVAGSTPGSAATTRLAVLPFENTGDSADAYFADGVTDAVRDKLTALPGLEVIASTSSGEYRRTHKSPQQIGQELGVRYLLIGKVRWAKAPGQATRVQVRPELIETRNGAQRWGDPFNATMTDVFEVQAQIASKVAGALHVALDPSARELLAERPTANLAAYDAYLRGQEVSRDLATDDPVALRHAITLYEQATASDPSFAIAWAQLARARSELYWAGVPGPELDEAAHHAAQQALTLAPAKAEGHLALGTYYFRVTRDNRKALAEFAEGHRLSPTSADLLTAMGVTEQSLGHWDAALSHFQSSQTLDPIAVSSVRNLGTALFQLRRYALALAAFDHGLSIAPDNMDLMRSKALTYLAQGDLTSAQGLVRTMVAADSTTAARYMASFGLTAWALTDAQQDILLRLSAGDFDNDQVARGLAFARTYELRGDLEKSRIYGDSVSAFLKKALIRTPKDGVGHVLYGLALAYGGRHPEAITEGEHGAALLPVASDALDGTWVLATLARVYMMTGEVDKALDALEELLRVPSYLSPGWLRIDPTFDPLRSNPRFQKLVQQTT